MKKACRTKLFLILGLVLVAGGLTSASDQAFSYVHPGQKVPDLRLARPDGQVESYLGQTESQISVFAFVKSGHARSAELAGRWLDLQKKFADQPVHWALILSDRQTPEQIAEWDSLAPGARVLIDSGDRLFGELGVILTPSVGIVDAEGLLQAYIPFRRINYSAVISAHLELVLGLITPEELEEALNPTGRFVNNQEAAAKSKLKLAKILFKRGRLDAALSQVESALAEYPELTEGYRLLAEVQEAAGHPDEAARTREHAARLSPLEKHPQAPAIQDSSASRKSE